MRNFILSICAFCLLCSSSVFAAKQVKDKKLGAGVSIAVTDPLAAYKKSSYVLLGNNQLDLELTDGTTNDYSSLFVGYGQNRRINSKILLGMEFVYSDINDDVNMANGVPTGTKVKDLFLFRMKPTLNFGNNNKPEWYNSYLDLNRFNIFGTVGMASMATKDASEVNKSFLLGSLLGFGLSYNISSDVFASIEYNEIDWSSETINVSNLMLSIGYNF